MKSANFLSLTVAIVAGSLMTMDAQVTLTSLLSFSGTNGATPGNVPEATLVQGRDGNFYGTTIEGGTNGIVGYIGGIGGFGTVFKITTNGTFTILVSFDNTNGSNPQAGLIQASDGNFYGTTQVGPSYLGSIYQMTPAGVLTSFSGANGNEPNGLVQGADGFLYGTTYSGGTNGYGEDGTVFKISTNGAFTSLVSFDDTNGENPQAALVQAADGEFYGTTVNGGTNGGWGTVFEITTNGLLTSLVSFDGTNGADPLSTLVLGLDGALYGTTSAGGVGFAGTPYTGNGTVFKVSTNGQLTILHMFTGFPNDGANPDFNGLAPGSDGSIYGTTFFGGEYANGSVFQISPDGSYTNIYSFDDSIDGIEPYGGLIQGNDGDFYGTTSYGGTNEFGTVFRLTVPLNPPANQITGVHVSGTNVLVTIQSVFAELYQLQYRTSLTSGAWADFSGAPTTGVGGPLTVTNLGGATMNQQFLRFSIIP